MEYRSDPMDSTPGIVNQSSIRSKTGLAINGERFERFMQSVDQLGGEDKATLGKIMEIINKNNNNNNNEDINWISFEEVMRYMRLTCLLSSRCEVRLLPDLSLSPLPSTSSSSLSAWKVDRLWRFKAVITKLGGICTAIPEAIMEEMRNGNKRDKDVNLKDVRSYIRALMPYFTRTHRGERLSDGARFYFRGYWSKPENWLSRPVIDTAEGGPGALGGGYVPVLI